MSVVVVRTKKLFDFGSSDLQQRKSNNGACLLEGKNQRFGVSVVMDGQKIGGTC